MSRVELVSPLSVRFFRMSLHPKQLYSPLRSIYHPSTQQHSRHALPVLPVLPLVPSSCVPLNPLATLQFNITIADEMLALRYKCHCPYSAADLGLDEVGNALLQRLGINAISFHYLVRTGH